MSKYAKKIVIRVFRENSWSENRVFMATITPRKKRHAIISQEINTETNKMKDWSRKRKTDFIIGVALQIYLLFPWVQHYTIYGYLFNTLKINDYVQMYNKTLLPSLKEKSWGYTKMSAFVFLIIIILKIKIKKKNLLLYIEIANALEQRPKQIQKKFVSNKKDNGLHGYGMKNIQDIVKKYDGIFQYKVYEDQLIFMISIYTDMHRDCY